MLESLEQLEHDLRDYPWRDNRDLARFLELIQAVEQEVGGEYVKSPKDADGVPIWIGDELIYTDDDGSEYCLKVDYMLLQEAHNEIFWKCVTKDEVYGGMIIDLYGKLFQRCHHYKPPTVKDIFDEFIDKLVQIVANEKTMTDEEYERKLDELRDAYATKFRLAEGE